MESLKDHRELSRADIGGGSGRAKGTDAPRPRLPGESGTREASTSGHGGCAAWSSSWSTCWSAPGWRRRSSRGSRHSREKLALATAEAGIDVLSFYDDAGSQYGMQVSPELWRAFIKPAWKAVLDCGAPAPSPGDLLPPQLREHRGHRSRHRRAGLPHPASHSAGVHGRRGAEAEVGRAGSCPARPSGRSAPSPFPPRRRFDSETERLMDSLGLRRPRHRLPLEQDPARDPVGERARLRLGGARPPLRQAGEGPIVVSC